MTQSDSERAAAASTEGPTQPEARRPGRTRRPGVGPNIDLFWPGPGPSPQAGLIQAHRREACQLAMECRVTVVTVTRTVTSLSQSRESEATVTVPVRVTLPQCASVTGGTQAAASSDGT